MKPINNIHNLPISKESLSIFSQTALAIAITALDGRWLFVTQPLCDMLGYTYEQLRQLDFMSVTYEEDIHPSVAYAEQLIEGHINHFTMEKRYVHSAGNIVWASITVSLIRDDKGEPSFFITQMQEITSKKYMEKELEESNERYKSLYEYNSNGIFTCDLRGNIMATNTAAEKITGLSQADLLNRVVFSLFMDKNKKTFVKKHEKSTALVQPMKLEVKLHHKSGHVLDVEIIDVPIIVKDQMVGFYIIFKNITKEKKLIKQLNEAQLELINTVRQQQGMTFKFKKMKGKFIHTLCDGQLMYRMGLCTEQIIGNELKDFFPQELAEEKEHFYQRAWNGEENVTYEATIGDITYLASLKPIKIDGAVTEVIASCVDISERKTAEEGLIRSEKLSAMGQLAAGVAHEIRNPLTALRGFTQLLKPELKHKSYYIDVMLNELDRINTIVNEFMTLAKPHYIRFSDSSIEKIVKSVVSILKTQAILNNANIILNIEESLPSIHCDENQLKQVLLNIIKNAIEAMPEGGDIRIIGKRTKLENILIQIIDQGTGIAEQMLPRVGEPFFTTKESGTGLGLMICQRIIEAHRGTFEIRSMHGQGTTVDIVLPI